VPAITVTVRAHAIDRGAMAMRAGAASVTGAASTSTSPGAGS
jgi:hypothetical protein